ncbi:MAG: AAC(3) family N-acetyltransferase [Candidatus Bathyarchaeota archaeon]|nr:AAC(3) family N-acetyltransferase [Candidatus Bathyarchaeota archaeon]
MKNENRKHIQENKFTKYDIINDLGNIGVNKGDHLAVALSFRSIGYVKGGPDAFIDALMEAVGTNGTVVMPTFTRRFHLLRNQSVKVDYIFDYRSTPSYTGIIPNALRKRKDAIRSKHPIYSVTAIGKLADYLTEGHNPDARELNPFMPYSKLAKIDGKVLCIGIGDRVVAIRHEAQYLAGLLDIIPPRFGVKYRDDEGYIKDYIERAPGGCTKRLHELVTVFRRMRLVKDGKIGMANSILLPANESLELTTNLLRNDPTLNLCNSIKCLWCRELERRINLYNRIKNPKFFQKNRLAIGTIATISKFRLSNPILKELRNKFLLKQARMDSY